ncbi:MAG TPA: hypothetical protein PLJ35_13145, partial [Anaerolineae bacterium]|nr:hypothetical protein [Anaerolineae bacterium]
MTATILDGRELSKAMRAEMAQAAADFKARWNTVPGLAVVRKIRGTRAVRWLPRRRIEGTHRLEGMLAVHGEHVRPGLRLDANIADIAPTVLAGLGLPVPIDMEGRVLE